MARVALSCVLIVAACLIAGCRKSANPSSSSAPSSPSAPAASTPGRSTRAGADQAKALSADDQLMLDYLKARTEFAELLEKKAPPEQSSAAAARSSAKLEEMHALPFDRQMALQKKYQKEWDAVKARVEKAIMAGQP